MIDETDDFDDFSFRSVATPNACSLPCITLRLTLAYTGARPGALNAGEAYRGLLKRQLESVPDVASDLLDDSGTGRNFTQPGWSLRVEDGENAVSGAAQQRLLVTLFGEAGRHAPSVLQAIAAGLLVDGVGDRHLAADIIVCEVYTVGRGWLPIRIPRLDETDAVLRWRQPMEILGLMPAFQVPTHDLEIRLHGRLHFKDKEKKAIEHAPTFGVLLKQIIDRVEQVAKRWGGVAVMPDAERENYLALANQIMLQGWTPGNAPKEWVSKDGAGRYPRGRLSGTLHYRADTPMIWLPLLPWLHAGRAIQVGQQTTMGAGGYDLVFLGHDDESGGRDTSIARRPRPGTDRKLADSMVLVAGGIKMEPAA